MKGFEIKINDETINAATDSVLSVEFFLRQGSKKANLIIGGLDSKWHHLEWLNKQLEIGDKFKVKLIEMKNITPFKERCPSDRDELKARYYKLKEELENKGLL